jgi:hypothetical protein
MRAIPVASAGITTVLTDPVTLARISLVSQGTRILSRLSRSNLLHSSQLGTSTALIVGAV